RPLRAPMKHWPFALAALAIFAAAAWLWIDARPSSSATADARAHEQVDDGDDSDAPSATPAQAPPALGAANPPASAEAPPTPVPPALVTGRCVDGDGRPIAGARVVCVEPAASADTGEDGRFTLALALSEDATSRAVTLAFAARFCGKLARST